jgi:hypothetical protein
MPKDNNGNELHDELGGNKVSDEGIVGEEKGFDPANAESDSVAAVSKASDTAPKAKPLPKTKAGMVQAAYDKMNAMKKDDLKKTLEKFMMEYDAEAGEEEMPQTTSGNGQQSESFDSDLKALVDSEATLSEGFKEKAEVIFEAALSSKVSEHVQRLEESYAKELAEETDRVREELVEKVDGYLNYVVESWMEDNKLAIENGLRADIAESFMGALKGVFTEHYVEVPESKTDLVDELAGKVEKLEEELNGSVQRSITLNERVKELSREKIIREAAGNLSETQAEKLKSLVEEVDFESEEAFTKKVSTIKESYFSGKGSSTPETSTSITQGDDLISEDTGEEETRTVSPSMARYVEALKK